MPDRPIQRAAVVVVVALSGALSGAMTGWSGCRAAVDPAHAQHPRAGKAEEKPGEKTGERPGAKTEQKSDNKSDAGPPPLAAPVQPTPPQGPLTSQAALVQHGETALVEAVARAGSRLVAVGVNGLVMLSDDDGLSWRQVQPPVQATLTGVLFLNDTVGWAIGHYGVVLRTEDGGESWSLALDAPRAAQITLDAALASNGSDNSRRKAIDDARRLGDGDPSRPFLLMQADGPDTLRVIGVGGMALETTDAGRHWHAWSAAIENPDALPLLGLAQRDGVMLVDGAKGTLLAGRPADGLLRLHSPADATFFGALDAGRFGFLLFGQQGNAFTGTLAQPATATRTDAWRQVDTPTQNSFTAGLLRRDGTVLLGDSAGMVWTLAGKPDDPHLDAASPRAPFPILSIAEAADGALLLAGGGGLLRVEPPPQAPQPVSAAPNSKAQPATATQSDGVQTPASGPSASHPAAPSASSAAGNAVVPNGAGARSEAHPAATPTVPTAAPAATPNAARAVAPADPMHADR